MIKLNIMIIMPTLSTGGAERVVVNFANWLVKNTNSEIYLVITESLNTIYEINSNVKVYEGNLGVGVKSEFKKIKYVRKKIKEINPNIIFTLFAKINMYALLSNHKDKTLIFSERANLSYRNRLRKLLSIFSVKNSDGLIFQTNRAKTKYEKWIVDKDTIVIGNPVGEHAINQSKISSKKENIIIAVGRLEVQKGFDILIKSFKEVIKKYPNYKLIIFGEGSERVNLEKMVKDLELENNVKLPGIEKNVVSYIAKSKIFVLSSRYEGMPNVLLEAMAVGTPCIATDCEFGPSELIVNYENGILVPVENIEILSEKIIELLENENLRTKIGTNSKKILETNSPDIIYKKYYDFMVKVYNERGKKYGK